MSTVATVTMRRERVSELWDEITPLLHRHWEEVAVYRDIPLMPDREVYAAMEMAGYLRCYTARAEASGELIGYAVFVVRRALHYITSLQAMSDVVYLAPEHRGGLVGMRMLRYAEEQLRAEGVQVVLHHAKLGHPALARCLERMGYAPQDVVYGRRLDHEE